jgi:hypothetical protein
MALRKRRQRKFSFLLRPHPGYVLDFRSGSYLSRNLHLEKCGLDKLRRLVRRWSRKESQEFSAQQLASEFLFQLARKRLHVCFTLFQLSARLHKENRAALSDQKNSTLWIGKHSGRDSNGRRLCNTNCTA